MPIVYKCPYFKWEERKKVYCECAKLSFETKEERDSYVKTYCAANPGWRECTVAQCVSRRYESEDET